MNTVRCKSFGPVTAWELGYGPIGRPIMTVHCYHVGRVMVDTGQRHMRRAVLSVTADRPINAVLLTHHHEDHSGNAAALAASRGAPVYSHPSASAKLRRGYRIRPYQHLIWGRSDPVATIPFPDIIDAGGIRLTPIHTPGHSRDHTCFLAADAGWLFSGDLFLGERIKYFRIDEDLASQIQSIRSILGLDFDTLFCAHRPMPAGGRAALRNKLQFLEDCRGAVAGLAAKGLGEAEVIRRLDTGQDRFARWLTLGNVSYAHLLRQAYRSAISEAG